jgi:hypothetical protein
MKKVDLSQPQLGLLAAIRTSFAKDLADQKRDSNGERIRTETDVESTSCKNTALLTLSFRA